MEAYASLRKTDSVESFTDERAAELLAEKRAKGQVKKKAPAMKPAAATRNPARHRAAADTSPR